MQGISEYMTKEQVLNVLQDHYGYVAIKNVPIGVDTFTDELTSPMATDVQEHMPAVNDAGVTGILEILVHPNHELRTIYMYMNYKQPEGEVTNG